MAKWKTPRAQFLDIVEIFGDGYEKPNKATRRAYNRARRAC